MPRWSEIAAIGGAGSAAARAAAVQALFARATEAGAATAARPGVRRDPAGRIGSLVQDGLAEAFGVPAAAVQRAAMLLGSTAAAAAAAGRRGAGRAGGGRPAGGRPVRPMLAASAPDPVAAVDKTGLPALVDTKLDGIRVQVHKDGPLIRLYTRTLDDITDRLPEMVRVVADLPPNGWCWTGRCSRSAPAVGRWRSS